MARSETLAALDAESFVTQAFLMLQTLLADRFALRAHVETRQLPVYALVAARGDGAPGALMTKVDVDCAAVLEAMKSGTRPPVRAGGRPNPCSIGTGPGRIAGSALDLSRFADVLADQVDRPVLDRTGFAGVFDLELTWSPEQHSDGLSIFTALQEQLGLKLESTTGPMEMLVIDSISQLTPD